jgi:virginiamycin A acetyltransferase
MTPTHQIPPPAAAQGFEERLRAATELLEAIVADRGLLAAAWWDWPADKVTRNLAALTGNDPGALDRLR